MAEQIPPLEHMRHAIGKLVEEALTDLDEQVAGVLADPDDDDAAVEVEAAIIVSTGVPGDPDRIFVATVVVEVREIEVMVEAEPHERG